ncbi:MAG: mono/diheme cytochrome c family protein [Myxococcota bacterium]|jgi:mono/diheme cytochrome c family protein
MNMQCCYPTARRLSVAATLRPEVTMRWLLLVGLVACGGESASDDPRVDDILSLTADEANGAILFGDNCSTCHGQDGSGGSFPDIRGQSADVIVDRMLTGPGSMPDFSDWPDQDVADVVAHVETL